MIKSNVTANKATNIPINFKSTSIYASFLPMNEYLRP